MKLEENTREILNQIEKLNHEMNLSDDNREQEYLRNRIYELEQKLSQDK